MKPHFKIIPRYYPKRMQRTSFIRTQTHKKKRLRWEIFLIIGNICNVLDNTCC